MCVFQKTFSKGTFGQRKYVVPPGATHVKISLCLKLKQQYPPPGFIAYEMQKLLSSFVKCYLIYPELVFPSIITKMLLLDLKGPTLVNKLQT